MVTKCAQCGKRTVVLYPDLWVYKRGNKFGYKYLCSWSCLREYDKEKGVEDMSFTQVKKDGTPAKKPGRKPTKKQIETPEGEFVTVATKVPPKTIFDDDVEAKLPKVEVPEKPKSRFTTPAKLEGFEIAAVRGDFGVYLASAEYNYFEFQAFEGDLCMKPEDWSDQLEELKHAAKVLGVEL